MRVSAGEISFTVALSRRAGILSGPDTLLGLSFCRSLLTPDSGNMD